MAGRPGKLGNLNLTTVKTFSSPKVVVEQPIDELYRFVTNFNNFRHLLADQVKNWESTENTCRFDIPGLPEFRLRIKEKHFNHSVKIVPDGDSPVAFELEVVLNSIDYNRTEVEIRLSADLNPFTSMIASGPLQNFVDSISGKVEKFDPRWN